jgi:uncharacterized membrane protein YeaQ/YmgE (transglycosylase-associated protein family)
MNITISDVISWLIVGGFAGSLAGLIVKRKKDGFGRMMNLAFGLAGAILGGAVVRLLKIDFGIGKLVLRWEDMVAALIGALILIVGLSIVRRKKKANEGSAKDSV